MDIFGLTFLFFVCRGEAWMLGVSFPEEIPENPLFLYFMSCDEAWTLRLSFPGNTRKNTFILSFSAFSPIVDILLHILGRSIFSFTFLAY